MYAEEIDEIKNINTKLKSHEDTLKELLGYYPNHEHNNRLMVAIGLIEQAVTELEMVR